MPIATGLVQAALPSLAYTPDGTAHAIWESNGGLYYSYQTPNRPWSKPIRVAAGLSPSMVVNKAGVRRKLRNLSHSPEGRQMVAAGKCVSHLRLFGPSSPGCSRRWHLARCLDGQHTGLLDNLLRDLGWHVLVQPARAKCARPGSKPCRVTGRHHLLGLARQGPHQGEPQRRIRCAGQRTHCRNLDAPVERFRQPGSGLTRCIGHGAPGRGRTHDLGGAERTNPVQLRTRHLLVRAPARMSGIIAGAYPAHHCRFPRIPEHRLGSDGDNLDDSRES
jgi:hypothetical protein